jgi:HD-like signal output (HDOD) protein
MNMQTMTPQTLVKDTSKLFSLPDIYFQIREMINDPRFSIVDVGQVLGKDPALSLRLLKIVNSSFYGFSARVDTVSRAITIIGINDLQNLVLATTVVDSFRNIPNNLIDMTAFWLRSISCGVIARLLAKKSAILHSERLFLMGLLHDIGSLVLYAKLPGKSLDVLLLAENNRYRVADLEQEIIGFTHADVGSELINLWGLPESLAEAIKYYLNPDNALIHKLDAHLLFLAARLSDCITENKTVADVLAEVPEDTLLITRLNGQQIMDAMLIASAEINQVFELIGPAKSFH